MSIFLFCYVASLQKKKRSDIDSMVVDPATEPGATVLASSGPMTDGILHNGTATVPAGGTDTAAINSGGALRNSRPGKLKIAIEMLVSELRIPLREDKSKTTNRLGMARSAILPGVNTISSHLLAATANTAENSSHILAAAAPVGVFFLGVFARMLGLFPRPRAMDRWV